MKMIKHKIFYSIQLPFSVSAQLFGWQEGHITYCL